LLCRIIPGHAAGRLALLRALFGVLRSDPPDTPVADRGLFCVDLLASQPERGAQFYSGLAGLVGLRESGAGFTRLVLQSQGYARGGIVPRPAGSEGVGLAARLQPRGSEAASGAAEARQQR
jgi:hypothetical protein